MKTDFLRKMILFNIIYIYGTYLNSKKVKYEYNVITMDWRKVANSKKYFKVARESVKVGIALGYFLIKLAALGIVKPSDIHVLGNSMGAHVAGISGNTFYKVTRKKIFRVTGLDPSSPGYDGSWCPWSKSERLKPDDANFVDVIHTARGFLAISMTLGHVDFYPNNGQSPQPHCKSMLIPWKRLNCSHASATKYYYESVNNPSSFESVECSSIKDFNDGKCNWRHTNFMGHYANDKHLGKFFLKTYKKAPYTLPLRSPSLSSSSSSLSSLSSSSTSSLSSSSSSPSSKLPTTPKKSFLKRLIS